MKKNPFISIITPTLNDIRSLKKLINNLNKQSVKNFEHIVADGGSQDGTINYLKKESKVDKFLTSKDMSMYKGINNALKICRGEVIGYINTDDLYKNYKYFELIEKAFRKKNIDCIYAGYTVKDLDKIISKTYLPLQFKDRQLVTLGMPFCQHTFFWNKKFKNIKFNLKYRICSDFDFIGNILLKSKKIGYLNSNVAIFNKHKTSFGEKNKKKGIEETREIIEKFKKKIKFNFIFFLLDRIFNFLNNFKIYNDKLYIIYRKK